MGPLVAAEMAVDVEFGGDQLAEHGLVATAVGFGDLGAEFALAAFEAAMFEGVERAFDLLGERRVGGLRRMVERVGEMRSGVVGGSGVERIRWYGSISEPVEQVGCGQIGDPLRVLSEAGCGKDAGRIGHRLDERAEQDALRLSERLGAMNGDAGGALRGGMLDLLQQERGVDA